MSILFIMNNESKGRRKHTRLEFTYPVKFELFSPDRLPRSFIGYIKDMSIDGACIQFEDECGRFNLLELRGALIGLIINVPKKESISLKALIRWIRKDGPAQSSLILMGLEFQEIDDRQIEQIDSFFRLKNKDHKMIWTLWDFYIQQN
jgi:hypothetical protein